MRVIQADPGADGWWGLVEDDGRVQHLLHADDVAGRDAERPTDAEWAAMIPAPAVNDVEIEAEDGTVL